MAMLAILRCGDQAYGLTIRREIESQTERPVSRGALYITLERLEKKGYLRSRLDDPSPQRSGRPRRYYELEPFALQALGAQRKALLRMWEGFEAQLTPGPEGEGKA